MATAIVRPRPAGVPADLGAPDLPPSKSHAQRAVLVAAGTAGGRIHPWPSGGDAAVMVAALRALGVAATSEGSALRLRESLLPGAAGAVDLGESGTALRMLPVVVALLGGELRVAGAARLAERPLAPVWQLFDQGGVEHTAATVPFAFDARGAHWPAALRVEAGLTSQAASGALIGLALRCRRGAGAGNLVVHGAAAPGYLRMTANVLRHYGYRVDEQDGAEERRFTVSVTVPPDHATDYRVPPDGSAAVFVATAAALHGLDAPAVGVEDHPDAAVVQDLARLRNTAGDIDLELGSHPDSFPALCIAAALRTGATALHRAPALRRKESDRIAAMASGLGSAGIACRETTDGLVVQGGWKPGRDVCAVDATADHRVVMALALLGTLQPVAVPHAGAAAKSWPEFWTWLGRIARVELRA